MLAGTIGSKDIQITCLKCGSKFKAGEAITISNKHADINEELKKIITTQGMLSAVKYYKEKTGSDWAESKRYVDSYAEKNVIYPKSNNGGCAGVIILFIVLTGSLITII